MKYVFIAALCVVSLSLGACNTTYRDGSKTIHVNDGYNGNGKFCPPGQAKKGNC